MQVRSWRGGDPPGPEPGARSCSSSSFPRRRAGVTEKLTLHPADPSDPVAPPYVGDQLEKHDVGSRECCRRICFDLSSAAAHGALDKGLIAAKPRVCWHLGARGGQNNAGF